MRWVGDALSVTDDFTFVDFSTPKEVYSGYGFGVTRLRGKDLNNSMAYVFSTAGLLDRLREPVTPLLRNQPDELGPRASR